MNRLKRFSISLAVVVIFSGVAMVTPASARDGSSGDTSTNTTTSHSGSDETTVADNTTTTSDNMGNDSQLITQFKEQAKEKVEAARQNSELHTESQRQQACTARKANLAKRMNRAVLQAKKHEAVFDSIYTRVKNFYTNKQLNVPDYSTLTTKVDAAQKTAQDSITALQTLDVNVDCTSQNVADSVSAFQQAVKSSRDSLKAYRAALTDLINSLKGASSGASSTSDTNSTNGTNQ